jgi:hypothetical protein
MPEGLSPIEVGRELHEHTKEPHEPAGGDDPDREFDYLTAGP